LYSPDLQSRYKAYAVGTTYAYTGVVLQTSKDKDHITWWLHDGIKPHEFLNMFYLSRQGVK
jgi:hypothetical protein